MCIHCNAIRAAAGIVKGVVNVDIFVFCMISKEISRIEHTYTNMYPLPNIEVQAILHILSILSFIYYFTVWDMFSETQWRNRYPSS